MGPEREQSYEHWEASRAPERKGDPLWRMTAYRLATYVADRAWPDTRLLLRNRGMFGVADQLYRAAGSVAANLAEGYSRSSGPDRVRYFEYSLGSARECREWYYRSAPILPGERLSDRLGALTRIVQLLMVAIPKERRRAIDRRPPNP